MGLSDKTPMKIEVLCHMAQKRVLTSDDHWCCIDWTENCSLGYTSTHAIIKKYINRLVSNSKFISVIKQNILYTLIFFLFF